MHFWKEWPLAECDFNPGLGSGSLEGAYTYHFLQPASPAGRRKIIILTMENFFSIGISSPASKKKKERSLPTSAITY